MRIASLLLSLLFLLPSLYANAQDVETEVQQLPWEVCNETSFIQQIATVTVDSPEPGTPLSVKGWIKLYPGNCQAVAAEKGTPRFVYARSAAIHQGGIREWKGKHEYCVSAQDTPFTAKTDISCALQNLQSRLFLRVIPTEHRTAFVEPTEYGKKAITAGIQRLLMDNDYGITRVDGIDGRKTTNVLNKFLKDHELATSISIQEKYQALEEYADDAKSRIGVTLCNESSARVWSAIAYEHGDELESRGWWAVEQGACLRPFTGSLKNTQVHIYARQEQPNGADKVLIVSSKSGKELCVGEARFSAIRQEFCEDQGYIGARFHTLPTQETGARVVLKDSNFSNALIGGLRQ